MQLARVAAPTPLQVPAQLRAALDQAVATGASNTDSWAARNPSGTPEKFDRDALAGIAPPPTGAAQERELADVHAAQESRTPAGDAVARELAHSSGREGWQVAIDEIGRAQGPAQARLATELLQASTERNAAVVDHAKQQFDRRRPYEVDPTITTVVYKPHGNASYPSGHTAGAYAGALVLAALLPERAAELREMADQVAYSRVYGGVHFPSDVVTGARIGSQVASDVLRRAGISQAAAAA